MSKLQEAIRRLQQQGGNSPQAQANALRAKIVGTVIGRSGGDIAGVRSGGRGHIVIDRDALRSSGYLPPVEQERHVAEQYRILKRPLLDIAFKSQEMVDSLPNLVMVSSALPGDGKTFNCLNLALSMAYEEDVSVLLVDADVARPHISWLLGTSREKGLTDVLKDDLLNVEDCILNTSIPGLDFLPAGTKDERSTELLASNKMQTLAIYLSCAQENRVVIIDSPPVLVTSEARVLASHVGQVAMIVCAGKTPKQAVLDAIASLDSSKAINVILNRAAVGFGAVGYGAYQYEYGSDSCVALK